MRVLLINYRYFVSGGPERYMFNVKALLEEHGHEVIPFSIAYDRNEPTPYSKYFASPLSDSSEVYFRDQRRSIRTYARSIERSFYSPEVYRRLGALIDEVRPEVALVLHYLRKLSPAVLTCLADKGVPFAVRLSDFAMVCPDAHLLRDSKPCELCLHGSWRHSVRHACVQGSRMASAVNYAATRFHQIAGYYDLIRKFIVPSRFTIAKMVEGGWAPDRLVHVPTMVAPEINGSSEEKPEVPTISYVGRLDPIKGVETLLTAAVILERRSGLPPFSLRIIGDGEPAYVESLQRFTSEHGLRQVRFEGEVGRRKVAEALHRSWCSVVPSLWYENVPNSALESMANRTPVIVSDHGSLREVVKHDDTGWVVAPGDAEGLAAALGRVISEPGIAESAGARALEYVSQAHSPERHYVRLMNAFQDLHATGGGVR